MVKFYYTPDVPASSPVSADQLIKSFPRVFADGRGALAGELTTWCWMSRLGQFNIILAEFQL